MQDRFGDRFDIAVIGAGIAGASMAAELAGQQRVVLLEAESQPGYHTTGRSAALFSETYGPPVIRALSRASTPFFDAPPTGFAAYPLLSSRGVLIVAREDQLPQLNAMEAELSRHGNIRRVAAEEVRATAPLLRASYAAAGLLEHGARDIDVHGLHHGYLRRFRTNGGELRTGSEVLSIEHFAGEWTIQTRRGTLKAGIVVNAAGAWADEVAAMASARKIGIVPKRRTAVTVAAPVGREPASWPMVVDVDEQFYLKPEAGRLLISPADETPSLPCDAQPEELDIAICLNRIETAFDLRVERVERKWAGLRSFVGDKTPVAGFDAEVADFFWLAGQGGYGIQTAPALARTAAALALGLPIPADIAGEGVTEAVLAPNRLKAAA